MTVPTRHSAIRLCVTCLIVLAVSLSATVASAQVLYGSVVGVVKDAQGASVPGATVTITNKETNLTLDTTTNPEGGYSFTNVLPGQYDLKVSLTGFREFVRSNVPVSISNISRVDSDARSRHTERDRDGRV